MQPLCFLRVPDHGANSHPLFCGKPLCQAAPDKTGSTYYQCRKSADLHEPSLVDCYSNSLKSELNIRKRRVTVKLNPSRPISKLTQVIEPAALDLE
jgi:hypothetical protein